MSARMSFTCKAFIIAATVLFASGCELLKQAAPQIISVAEPGQNLCETEKQKADFVDFCNIEHWIDYIFEIQEEDWSNRFIKTNEIGDKPYELIQKILLSQGADTPYQNRLRAQNWIVKVDAESPPTISKVLNNIVYVNSKQLLEFESAITILSQVNARQQRSLAEIKSALLEREEQIQIQQSQIDQLLKIEADLIKNNIN